MAKQVNFNGYLLRQFGAYIRTDLSALVEINGVATGIIGIVGLAERGPLNTATTISGYTQLVNTFGDGPLVRHGLAAYIGGASTLVAVRLDDEINPATTATLQPTVSSTDGYEFSAREAGTYGDQISVRVDTPSFRGTLTANSGIPFYSSDGVLIPQTVGDVTDAEIGQHYVVENWDYQTTDGYYTDSYTIFTWNGSKWSISSAQDLTSEISVRLGSVEETITVPYYIPEYDWMDTLAESTGTYSYFVLKNSVTNQVREIPRNWLAGYTTLTFDDFEDVINDLKDDDEVLLGYTSASGDAYADVTFEYAQNAPTPYPFVLVEHIVNYGGMGSGPSAFITISDENSLVVNPSLVTQIRTSLSGGFNSVDGTSWTSMSETNAGAFTVSPGAPSAAWTTALGVLESEEVNFVLPAYMFGDSATFATKYSFFKSLAAQVVAHVNLMSNTPNRQFRTSVLGLPSGQNGASAFLTADQFLSNTEDITGVINSDRIQLWGGGFRSTVLRDSTTPYLYGAEWLASFATGAHASREVSVSLTFSQLAGIFSDGLEYAWTTAQRDELYGRSLAFALKRRTSTGAIEFVAAHNYTSFTGAPSKGIQLFITRRITDYMNSFLYKNLEENFIGRRSLGADTAARIDDFVDALLRRLVTEDALVTYSGLTVTVDSVDPTIYYVEFSFQPVTEINFILTTNKLVYNLA